MRPDPCYPLTRRPGQAYIEADPFLASVLLLPVMNGVSVCYRHRHLTGDDKMSSDNQDLAALEHFDPERRKLLRMIALGAVVYAAPTVASFSMSGVGGVANAQVSNQTRNVPAVSTAGLAALAGGIAAASAIALRKSGKDK